MPADGTATKREASADESDQQPPDVVPGTKFSALKQARPTDYLVRFAFGAAVSIVAGILGKAVSPRFGGMFLAFPAILPASLTLLQEKEGTRRADRNAIGAVLGGVALVVFAGVGEAGFTHFAPGLVLLVALGAWLAVAFMLYALLAVLRPRDCDRNQD